MRRIVKRVRTRLGPERDLRVVTPTNALALSRDDLTWCRREGIELAVSVDGGWENPERRYADGRSCAGELMDAIPDLLQQVPPGSVLARMTVTPANVENLCSNIRALGRLGFERIVYLPDYLADWSEATLALWQREHQRLATWLIGAKAAGKKTPDLPAWRAIEARLLRAAPRQRCGAGIDQVTVTPDGGMFPCYRFAYAANAEAWRLGNVPDGFTQPQRLAALRNLDAHRLRPEHGDCATCTASDGCTHFCPAIGFLASGDIAGVPAVACRLMGAQVAGVRGLCTHVRRAPRARATSPGWAAAAVMAAAITGVGSCTSDIAIGTGNPDARDANVKRDGGPVIVLEWDAAPDRALAVEVEAGEAGGEMLDADEPDTRPYYGGGICAPAIIPDTMPPAIGGTCP